MVIDKFKHRAIYPKDEYTNNDKKPDIPEGKWEKCPKCQEIIYKDKLKNNMKVCPYCKYHFRLSAKERIQQIVDENSFNDFNLQIETKNPLDMPEYLEKLKKLREENDIDEAVICGTAKIFGEDVVLCVMDCNFFMGSMGTVVGERITDSVERAIMLKLPVIIFCASGGARMQEGILALMQMAKTSSAIAKANEEGILYISVLTDPTYGGVTASFATLGDIILAEPGSMIGFAGPRVIKQTIGEELPDGFQTAQFQLEHGFIDKIVERKNMKETLYKLIMFNKR